MDDIHIDAFVNKLMEKLFSPLNRLYKNKNRRSKTLQKSKFISGSKVLFHAETETADFGNGLCVTEKCLTWEIGSLWQNTAQFSRKNMLSLSKIPF